MNKIFTYINISIFMVISANVFAGNIEKGKEKSAACVSCHGVDGISVSTIWPKLAGQHASYISSQLYEFQKGAQGKRNNAVMYGISLALSNEDIADLSAYYGSLEKSIGTTSDEDLKLGQNIYRGGNMEYKIQAVMALMDKEIILHLYLCFQDNMRIIHSLSLKIFKVV